MPELPEVETIVQDLNKSGLIGHKIKQIIITWPRIVDPHSPDEFIKIAKNQTVKSIERRGKYILFKLANGTLSVHLRMTGKFKISNENTVLTKHEHLRLEFANGLILTYNDTRKFGRWSFHESIDFIENKLGIEPLTKDFTLPKLTNLLKNHHTKIKAFLLNQKYIAGLGNIYVDEALWEAKIHPLTPTNEVPVEQTKALFKAIPNVLLTGLQNQGTSLGKGKGNYYNLSGERGGHQYKLKVFSRTGQDCPRCGHKIIKTVVAQRGTHLCPHCQKV